MGQGVLPISTQDTDETADFKEVVVTGSRVIRYDLTTPSTVPSVGDEMLQLTDTQNVGQVLATLPQTTPGFGGSSGVPEVHIFGTGAQNTTFL